MPTEREEYIEFTEVVEVSHRDYLSEFDEKVWPVLKERGYTKDTALLYWMLNRIDVAVQAMRESLEA